MVVAGEAIFAVYQPGFSFPPVSFVCLFWLKKWLNPFKRGFFVCRKTFKKS